MRQLWERFRPRTLSGQLALGGITWIALWAVGLLLAFDVLLSHVLNGQVDAALGARAEAVAATVQVQGGQLRIRSGTDDQALDAGTSIYQGQVLIEGAGVSPNLREDLVQHGRRTEDRETLGTERYLALPVTSGGQQVGTIIVSSDVGIGSRLERAAGIASVLLILLTLLFTFFALRATIGRALRPVRAMGDQASAWSDRELDRRFDPDAGPLELRQLATTLNALLERIAAALRHERSFTAELSHELRTPLAHLHAEVDLLAAGTQDPRAPEPVTGQDLDALLISIRRLEGLVETALVPARAERAAPGLGRISEALEGLRAPATSTARLDVIGDTGITLAVESDIVRRALNPVLENAFRYAVAEVRIEIVPAGGLVQLRVSDDGGRLDPAEAEQIFEAGFRGGLPDGHPGAGLGLALARRICRSAGGDITAQLADGRTVFTLTLPRV